MIYAGQDSAGGYGIVCIAAYLSTEGLTKTAVYITALKPFYKRCKQNYKHMEL
jgi:hypothetical protein